MCKQALLALALLMTAACARPPAAPAATEPPKAAAATPLPAEQPHLRVTMPPGWPPIDMSKAVGCQPISSVNEDLRARIMVAKSPADEDARDEAQALAGILRQGGMRCSAVTASADGAMAAFAVRRGGVRGKIVVRHFEKGAFHVVVMGQWPQEADAQGRKAVDAVAASAEYR